MCCRRKQEPQKPQIQRIWHPGVVGRSTQSVEIPSPGNRLDELGNILGCFITFRSSIRGERKPRVLSKVWVYNVYWNAITTPDFRRWQESWWVFEFVSKFQSITHVIVLRVQLGNLKRLWSKSVLFKNPEVLKIQKPWKILKDPSLSNMFQLFFWYILRYPVDAAWRSTSSTSGEATFAENPENQENVETASWAARETGNQPCHLIS